MRDPTIPHHVVGFGGRTSMGPTWAKLVQVGDAVSLVDIRRGYSLTPSFSVSMVASGGWGNALEGIHRAPRPWVYNGDEVVVEGDVFLVVFVDDAHNKPVILGYARTPSPADADFFPAEPIGADPNPIRVRAARRDASTGAVQGTLQVTALDGGNGFQITIGGETFGQGSQITIDNDAGTIELTVSDTRVLVDGAGTVKLGQGSETHPVGLGDELVQAIQTLTTAVQVVHGIAAGKIPSAPPDPTTVANLLELAGQCAASLSAGAPMLSSIVKVQ